MPGPPRRRRNRESLATLRAEIVDEIPPSRTTDLPCHWCTRIKLRYYRRREIPREKRERLLQEFFHSDCECRCKDSLPPSSTCGFCQHLNFKHLVNCVLISDRLHMPIIFSDWYCRKDLQNKCQLCNYMAGYVRQIGASEEIGLDLHAKFSWHCCGLRRTEDRALDDITTFQVSLEPARQLDGEVNWELIKSWTIRTYKEKEDLPHGFRAIDVWKYCITTPSSPVDYVALSYVWGNSPETPFQASTANIKDLQIEGALRRVELPRTIKDAMKVCRRLNQQYLWVDRLCILQDDAESKHGQINCMDTIFRSSQFAIIALTGKDANAGLPGVSTWRENRMKILDWQGITLNNRFPAIQELVRRSTWGNRGWTFQEEVCSTKNLYFTDYGVYHACYLSPSAGIQNVECNSEKYGPPQQPVEFDELIVEYTRRSFTFPRDILRAFTGILNKQYGQEHHFGIPTYRFGRYIQWQPLEWTYETMPLPECIPTDPVSQVHAYECDIFPSWSWVSAPTKIWAGTSRFETVFPVTLWAFPRQDGGLTWVSAQHEENRLRSITVDKGLMSTEQFPIQPNDNKDRLVPETDRDTACKKLGRIIAFTQIAFLRLKSTDYRYSDGRHTFLIMSSADECVGGIWLPTSSLEFIYEDGHIKEMHFEFMALSTSGSVSSEHNIFTDTVYESSTLMDILTGVGCSEGPKSSQAWKQGTGLDREHLQRLESLSVMLVWRASDPAVARRLGIGRVFLEKWLGAKPSLKTIVLE